jgi:hypothetical protein
MLPKFQLSQQITDSQAKYASRQRMEQQAADSQQAMKDVLEKEKLALAKRKQEYVASGQDEAAAATAKPFSVRSLEARALAWAALMAQRPSRGSEAVACEGVSEPFHDPLMLEEGEVVAGSSSQVHSQA